MPSPYRVYQIDAFTRQPFCGNPAGVVANADGLLSADMQAIARELNNSETAFILSPKADDHDVHVRFFTPTTEVPICGHATIAAHFVRALEGTPTGRHRHLTGAGVLPVEIERGDDGTTRIWMTQQPAIFEEPLNASQRARLLRALAIRPDDLAAFGPVQIVSTGHSKVMIPLQTRKCLDALTPDLDALVELSAEIGCNGYYPFTLDAPRGGTDASGRMFAPAIGIPEDPVTGNAAGPLGAYLLRSGIIANEPDRPTRIIVGQGDAIGRLGSVLVELAQTPTAATNVRIAGEAVMIFRTQLEVKP